MGHSGEGRASLSLEPITVISEPPPPHGSETPGRAWSPCRTGVWAVGSRHCGQGAALGVPGRRLRAESILPRVPAEGGAELDPISVTPVGNYAKMGVW